MADEIQDIQQVNPVTVEVDGEKVEVAGVQSVTTEIPHEADASSAPGPYKDLDVNRPPVSTNDPETPIAHSLIAGAGAPTGPPEIHPETHVADNAYVSSDDKERVVKVDAAPADARAQQPAEAAAPAQTSSRASGSKADK